MENINSFQESANALISKIESTKTYDWNRFSNSVTSEFKSLMGRGIITPEGIKSAIRKAILNTTQKQIEHATKPREGGERSEFYYVDHFLDTDALKYCVQHCRDQVDIEKLQFDHGETLANYESGGGKYDQVLYKKLLRPDPVIKIDLSNTCLH